MMMSRTCLACLVLLLPFSAAFAQNTDNTQRLSLSEAWQQAADYYPGVQQKKAQIRESQVQKDIVASDRLPQTQLQVQNSIGTFAGSAGSFFPLPGVFNVNNSRTVGSGSSTATNFFGSVVSDWNLIGFGKINNAIKAADAEVEQAKSNLNAYNWNLQAKVTRLYFDILYNSSNLTWANKNVKRVKQILDLSKSLAEAGLKPGADTSLAAAAYLQIQGEMDNWTGRYSASKTALTEFVPVAVSNLNLPVDNYLQQRPEIPADEVNPTHPYLKVVAQQVAVSEARRKAAASQALPNISLIAGYSARGSGLSPDGIASNSYSAGFNNMAGNYLVGVGLTWNITGAYTSSLQKKRLTQRIVADKNGYAVEENQLKTSLDAIQVRATNQVMQSEKTHLAVQKANEAYNLYVSRYESGLISLTELLQIQAILQQTEKTNIDVHGQLWQQLIDKAELSGNFNYLSTQF